MFFEGRKEKINLFVFPHNINMLCIQSSYCGYIKCLYPLRVNPSAVLDFIWGCLHKPCLWQERVKREAVVNSSICLVSERDSLSNSEVINFKLYKLTVSLAESVNGV